MPRFQTHQSRHYRVYIDGKLVQFNDGVAVVDEATAAKMRADPLCGHEYFEVTAQDLAAANAAVKTDDGDDDKGQKNPGGDNGKSTNGKHKTGK
jgi:hypothetical protein